MKENIKVKCIIHNKTENVRPSNLMYGHAHGCKKCAEISVTEKNRLNYKDIKNEITNLPQHIEYLEISFNEKSKQSEIILKCEFDGIETVSFAALRRSRYKCPECGNRMAGQAAGRLRDLIENNAERIETELGLIEVEVFNIQSLKIGIFNCSLEKRYKWYMKKVFFRGKFKEKDAIILEYKIKNKFNYFQDQRIFKAGMRSGKRWGGDTECFSFKAKKPIISEIKKYINNIKSGNIDYFKELDDYVEPTYDVTDTSKEKGLYDVPIKIVCMTENNKVFESITDASLFYGISAGNLASILRKNTQWHNKKKLRFCYYKDFINNSIPEIPKKKIQGRKVRCIDTGKIYENITLASQETGATHITSVCRGRRNISGGLKWEYVD
jgi:hypothetical protein